MRRLIGSFVLFSALSSSLPARAQQGAPAPATPAPKDVARAFAERGIERFEAGAYDEAIELFESAEKLFHAPPHLLYIARAHEKRGHWVAARRTLAALVAEQLPADAPAAFKNSVEEGKRELAALEPRIPSVTLQISGAEPDETRATIDGAAVALTSATPLDAGRHEIVVSTASGDEQRQSVELTEGAKRVVSFTFDPASPVLERITAPTWIAFGVGAAGLVLGGATGAASLGKVSDLESACPSQRDCNPRLATVADEARTLGTVSTVGFVLGAVGVAAGTTILVFDLSGKPLFGGGGSTEAAHRASPWTLGFGPASIQLTGAFQ